MLRATRVPQVEDLVSVAMSEDCFLNTILGSVGVVLETVMWWHIENSLVGHQEMEEKRDRQRTDMNTIHSFLSSFSVTGSYCAGLAGLELTM